MSDPRLGTLEVHCDAPPYGIVWACEDVGFRTPLDVRWCRVSTALKEHDDWWHQLWSHPWKVFQPRTSPLQLRCSCGQPLPRLEKVEFTFLYGSQEEYLVGQCPRCRTMYWEEG